MVKQLLRWLLIASVIGALAGSASALFLVMLEWATRFRETHTWIIGLLPIAGMLIGLGYHFFGKSVESGHNLILDEIHEPRAEIPLRMTPLILLGTVGTHLFGGSAGREGTAVQMGASLADQLSRPLRMSPEDRRTLLMAGLSAGFGSVFGTPLAGAVFGLEVITIGRMKYEAFLPCLIAAIVGDQVTTAWGIHHTIYSIPESAIPKLTAITLLSSVAAGIACGITAMLFARTTHALVRGFKEKLSFPPFRPLLGGTIVALLVWTSGSTRYIGLGIPTIVEAFEHPLPPLDFAGKFLFTTLTLGSGFKGGEVTPLFFIGATLGNALAHLLPLALPLLAGIGFVAVFAGAANAPLTSSILAMELFGSKVGTFAALACVASYLFSGGAGIYRSQRSGHNKNFTSSS